MCKLFFFVSAIAISFPSFCAEGFSVAVTQADPYQLCGALESHLPKRLEAFGQLGKILKKTVTVTNDYDCDQIKGGCRVYAFEFSDLKLNVRASGVSNSPWIMGVTISSPRWQFLDNIYVGQGLEVVEKRFGVAIPREKSPAIVEGECTPLTVWHRDGRITKLALDCQACY